MGKLSHRERELVFFFLKTSNEIDQEKEQKRWYQVWVILMKLFEV